MTEAKTAASTAVGGSQPLFHRPGHRNHHRPVLHCSATARQTRRTASPVPAPSWASTSGAAVREATLEALRWHNGLEPSYTRGLFHALGRYGVKEDHFLQDIAPYLSDSHLELLKQQSQRGAVRAAGVGGGVCPRQYFGPLPLRGFSCRARRRRHCASRQPAWPPAWPAGWTAGRNSTTRSPRWTWSLPKG